MSERTGDFWDVMEGRKPPPPAAAALGFKLLDIDPSLGTIRVQFDAKPEFLNPMGVVPGGFLAAMLDDTLGPALVCTLPRGQFAPTIELKVNFIKPAPQGASQSAWGTQSRTVSLTAPRTYGFEVQFRSATDTLDRRHKAGSAGRCESAGAF